MTIYHDPIRKTYDEGYEAAIAGQSVGANPYDPEDENDRFESWLDGWSIGHRERQEAQDAGC